MTPWFEDPDILAREIERFGEQTKSATKALKSLEVHTSCGGWRRGSDWMVRSRSRESRSSECPASKQVCRRETARRVRAFHLLWCRPIGQHVIRVEDADAEPLAQAARQVHVVDEQHVHTERCCLHRAQRFERLPEGAAVRVAKAPTV